MSKQRYPFKREPGGFSLTEMLIATAIMAIGLVMVATIFPVGMKLTGLSAERSVAAVTADEAFTKIQLYGLRDFEVGGVNNWLVPDPNVACLDYQYVTNYAGPDNVWNSGDETALESGFLYPSAELSLPESYKYHWSALCRRSGDKDVQVTVFATRKSFPGLSYYGYDPTGPTPTVLSDLSWPVPVPVNVRYNNNNLASPPLKELVVDVTDPINAQWQVIQANLVFSFFDEGYTIVNNRDGRICRILEVKDTNGDGKRETMVLWDDWQWDGYDSDPLNPPSAVQTETVWVVPPGVGSSRYPCVGVFQKVIRFDDIE